MNFCTLFNSSYAPFGLALLESLKTVLDDFTLYILCIDDALYSWFLENPHDHVVPVSLQDVEKTYPELLIAKSNRDIREYCWTLGSVSIYYMITQFNLDSCTYLDSDTYFYSSPKSLIRKDDHALITMHDYAPQYDMSENSGKYCVQYMYFKNSEEGMKVLRWWKDACIEWCYDKMEANRFGDQKYLDDWTSRFDGVRVLYPLGIGLAPWNCEKYKLLRDTNHLIVQDRITKEKAPLVFYHFHGLRALEKDYWKLSGESYVIDDKIVEYLYKPYIALLKNCMSRSDLYLAVEKLEWAPCRLLKRVLKNCIKSVIVGFKGFSRLRYFFKPKKANEKFFNVKTFNWSD